MTRLRDHLGQLIAAEGPLSIAEFMHTAMTAQDLGYYMRGDPFGAGGDFVTAPEVSQIFGELIGLWSVAVWEALGSPARFSLVELGPGRGTLMSDALRAARIRPAFLDAADFVLVEMSPVLRQRQREALRGVRVRNVRWADQFDAVPGQPLIVWANEFFDALPIRQFVATAQGWRERCIGLASDNSLTFVLSPAPLPSNFFPLASESCVEGAVFEFGPARNALAEQIGRAVAANGGAAQIIDYGFTGPAIGDTFQAMRAHSYVSALEDPGHVDLTSHVDFTALAAGFAAGGAVVYGPIEQSAFLERLGARERMEALLLKSTGEQGQAVTAGYTRLTDAKQMGSLFKTLVAASPGLLPPGFASNERR